MIKRLLFTLMALVLLPAAALLTLELLFGQWVWSDPWAATRRLNLIRNEVIHYDVSHIAGRTESVVRYTRDADGLRGPCAAREVEILSLGGSTTDQRLIGDGQTWQDIIAQQEQVATGRRLCVSNAGVDGHSTFGHLAAFDQWFVLVPELRPRVVMLYIGLNDVGRLTPQHGYDDTQRADESAWQRMVRERSALFELRTIAEGLLSGVRPILPYAGHRKEPPPPQAYTAAEPSRGMETLVARNTAAFEDRLQRLVGKVKAMGAVPVCVSQPHRFAIVGPQGLRGVPDALFFENRTYNGLDFKLIIEALNPVMARVCTAAGGKFIDAQAAEFPASDFYDAMHMTPAGAQRLGRFLHQELTRGGLVVPSGAARTTP